MNLVFHISEDGSETYDKDLSSPISEEFAELCELALQAYREAVRKLRSYITDYRVANSNIC